MKPPSREETDARVDQNLAKASWVDPEGVDGIRVELYKGDYHELRVLEWRFKFDPSMQKTPLALEHYDDLCQRILRHEDSFALSPRARNESKVNSTFHAQVPVTPDRSPEHLKKVARQLALSGAFGEEAVKYAQMAEQVDAIETDNDTEDDDGSSTT